MTNYGLLWIPFGQSELLIILGRQKMTRGGSNLVTFILVDREITKKIHIVHLS